MLFTTVIKDFYSIPEKVGLPHASTFTDISVWTLSWICSSFSITNIYMYSSWILLRLYYQKKTYVSNLNNLGCRVIELSALHTDFWFLNISFYALGSTKLVFFSNSIFYFERYRILSLRITTGRGNLILLNLEDLKKWICGKAKALI